MPRNRKKPCACLCIFVTLVVQTENLIDLVAKQVVYYLSTFDFGLKLDRSRDRLIKTFA